MKKNDKKNGKIKAEKKYLYIKKLHAQWLGDPI